MLRIKKYFRDILNKNRRRKNFNSCFWGRDNSYSVRTFIGSSIHHSSNTIHNTGEFIKPQNLDSDLFELVCTAWFI